MQIKMAINMACASKLKEERLDTHTKDKVNM